MEASPANKEQTHLEPALLATRRHFKALDGLRGVAALAVVTFHFMEMAIYDYTRLFIGHGFLAVDFFFCLSGFVIGYAYDDRLKAMGIWEFFKSRLIRLHPMVVMGSVLGLVTLLADPFAARPPVYGAAQILLMFLASIFLIPYPAMHERGFNLFSLNAPAWSLFWEYVVNVFYALVLFRLSRRWLIGFTLAAALVLCLVGYKAGVLSGGWSGGTFWHGGARVAFSFAAGLLVYRSGWVIRSRIGFGGLTLLLLPAFVMPYATGGWVREAAVILIYFPLLIALGAGATLTPRSERICTFAGDISYPLYMTHYAVIWSWGSFYGRYWGRYKFGMGRLYVVVACGVVVMVGLAYLVMRFYDIPVRRYLAARRRPAAV